MHTSLYKHHRPKKKEKKQGKRAKNTQFKKKKVLNCKYNLTVKAHSHTAASLSSRNAKRLPAWALLAVRAIWTAQKQRLLQDARLRQDGRPGNRSVLQTEQLHGLFYTEKQQTLTRIPLAQRQHTDLIFLPENTFPNKLRFSINFCVSI